MEAYKELFASHEIFVAQMLLTREDFNNEDRTLHMRNTMFTLVDEGVVPIINENDTVSVDEIKIGDNDTLSALAIKPLITSLPAPVAVLPPNPYVSITSSPSPVSSFPLKV